MTHGDPSKGGRHGDEGLKIGRQGLWPIAEFLDENGEKPFFLWYAPMLPHQPHNPPERLLEKYTKLTDSPHVAKYWAMVEWWDESCGELLAELKKRDLEKNTLVIYLADNGWIQDPQKPAFAPKSKRSRYDGGLRTPIMFRWPGKIEPARNGKSLVSSIDIAPTVLAACDAPPIANLAGLNLLPHARRGSPIDRQTLFGAIYEHDIHDIDRAAPGLQHRWCIDGTWKLIVPRVGDEVELYDLAADPHEERNLADQQPERVAELRKQLDGWWDGK